MATRRKHDRHDAMMVRCLLEHLDDRAWVMVAEVHPREDAVRVVIRRDRRNVVGTLRVAGLDVPELVREAHKVLGRLDEPRMMQVM